MMSRRCSARAKATGARCRRAPIAGGPVCRVHGGAAPQVKRAAEDRLRELIDPALAAMGRALRSHDIRAAVVAARDILTRCGYADVSPAPAPRLSLRFATDAELDALHAIHEAIAAREAANALPAQPVRALPAPVVIDVPSTATPAADTSADTDEVIL